MKLFEAVPLANWIISTMNSIELLLNSAWDKVRDEYGDRGWHQMSYYVAEPDQELDQWKWGDVGLGEESVCEGGPMNRGCVLAGAVVQYGLTCCSSACNLCDVGTFNVMTADDAVYEFWTTEHVQEYVKEGQCLDDPEGKFTGVQVSKHDYAKMLQVTNGWWLNNANHQSQTTNWVFTTVLGRNQSRRDEMTTTVTREDDSEVTVTQLIDVLGIGAHCKKFHDSGSDQVHTVNCIAP